MTIPSSRSLILWISVFSITSPSADFRRLRKTSDFFGNLRKWSCRLQKSQHPQNKNLTLISQKKLAGIEKAEVEGGAVILRAMVRSDYPMRQSCWKPSFFSVFLFDNHRNWTQTASEREGILEGLFAPGLRTRQVQKGRWGCRAQVTVVQKILNNLTLITIQNWVLA